MNINSAFSQYHDKFSRKYYSTEEQDYFKRLRNERDQPKQESERNSIIDRNPLNYVNIIKLDRPTDYNANLSSSPYFDAIVNLSDSIMINKEKLDSAMQAIENDKIGIITRLSVIKHEKLDNYWAIIYISPLDPFDDFIYGGWGYWLALSFDNGGAWNKYYTGLSENFPYCFKRESNIPLWKNADTLQIESVAAERKGKVIHPMPAEFVLVQDSIAVQFSIQKVINDSDKDGLTDIVERKMMLDPKNPDSDGDGIWDSQDRNPRFKSVNNEKTMIYNAILNNKGYPFKVTIEIDLSTSQALDQPKSDSLDIDSKSLSVFITDNEELMGLNPTNETLIVMTSMEYDDYVLRYPSHSIKKQFSQMFKCDKIRNAYKIHESCFTGGSTYLVKKTKKGWKITRILQWIS